MRRPGLPAPPTQPTQKQSKMLKYRNTQLYEELQVEPAEDATQSPDTSPERPD